jgi:hypothetical protein
MLKRGRESKQPLSIQIVNSETPKRDKKMGERSFPLLSAECGKRWR